MAAQPPVCEFGWKAPDFRLPATNGRAYSLAELQGRSGTVVMFICNHCPYVKAVIDRVVADARALQGIGVASVAICSNDARAYPEDSFDNMRVFAERHGFPFPYLHDEDQAAARAYGAVCTPDFFGFNAERELQYRGRIYEVRNRQRVAGARRELFDAMVAIASDGRGPAEQHASIGCSIKWRETA
jgi:peroxiredoxin